MILEGLAFWTLVGLIWFYISPHPENNAQRIEALALGGPVFLATFGIYKGVRYVYSTFKGM